MHDIEFFDKNVRLEYPEAIARYPVWQNLHSIMGITKL